MKPDRTHSDISTREPPEPATVKVSRRGAQRARAGHPWIYRSDVDQSDHPPGVVSVVDERARPIGRALWSPASEIRLRMLTTGAVEINREWWCQQIERARSYRDSAISDTTAYRVVHGEADGLPSLIVDCYGDYVVAQLLSAGLEQLRDDVIYALREVLAPAGILLRNDATVRRQEGLALEVTEAAGTVPERLEVSEADVRFYVLPHTGQKTGAFLDQRENRALLGRLARGRTLDVFTYQGLFALHMARSAEQVRAVDSSATALAVAKSNAQLNGIANVEWIEANAFDYLRALATAKERFDTIVLDPPAFAKRRESLERALAGYKEINLRALRLLAPGGTLGTFSCSYHVDGPRFFEMLAAAARDSGRRVALVRSLGQSADHPTLLTVPETGYLKGALVQALD